MKPTPTRRFARLIVEAGVPDALARVCEARGADYIAAKNLSTGLYAVRVPRGDREPHWLRVDGAGRAVVVEAMSRTVQVPPVGWPVAGETEAAQAA